MEYVSLTLIRDLGSHSQYTRFRGNSPPFIYTLNSSDDCNSLHKVTTIISKLHLNHYVRLISKELIHLKYLKPTKIIKMYNICVPKDSSIKPFFYINLARFSSFNYLKAGYHLLQVTLLNPSDSLQGISKIILKNISVFPWCVPIKKGQKSPTFFQKNKGIYIGFHSFAHGLTIKKLR